MNYFDKHKSIRPAMTNPQPSRRFCAAHLRFSL